MSDLETYVTYRQLAEALGIAERTLKDWVRLGKIPYTRIGGKAIRFKKSAVAAWLKKREVRA